MDVRLLEALGRRPAREREALLRIAREVQKRGPVLHSRLVGLLRYLGQPSTVIRSLAGELEVVGVVEVIGPGRNRRGVHYRWTGTAEPIVLDPRVIATRHEQAIVDVLKKARPHAICHSCLLRRVSPLGVRARDLHALIWKARRFGLVELARTAHGGRAYFWTGLVRPPASATEPAAAAN